MTVGATDDHEAMVASVKQIKEIVMFKRILISALATVAIAGAGLTATANTASAHGFHHGHHHHHKHMKHVKWVKFWKHHRHGGGVIIILR